MYSVAEVLIIGRKEKSNEKNVFGESVQDEIVKYDLLGFSDGIVDVKKLEGKELSLLRIKSMFQVNGK